MVSLEPNAELHCESEKAQVSEPISVCSSSDCKAVTTSESIVRGVTLVTHVAAVGVVEPGET